MSATHKTTTKAERRKVRAVTRIRPFFEFENKSSESTELESCVIPIPPNKIGFQQQKYCEIIQQTFKFDAVYDPTSTQEEIFQNEVECLMDHAFSGKKCTVFCYGPTGSGKTFTSFGESDNLGIMGRTIELALSAKANQIKQHLPRNDGYSCRIKLSCLEIYNEAVYDLLSGESRINRSGLGVRQVGQHIVVQGLSKREIVSMAQFHDFYKMSMKQRKTAFTALNAHSSRSHAIYSVHLEQAMAANGKSRSVWGKISIADLAGSENNKRTENTGERMKESKNINKSLLALGSVIDALNNHRRPPYRDSVLTRLLSDCLGGDSISTMICCVSGSLDDSSMTRRCLEFGSRTRRIENVVVAHVESKKTEQRRSTKKEKEQRHSKKKEKKTSLRTSFRGKKNENSRKRVDAKGDGKGRSSERRNKRRHDEMTGNHRKHTMLRKEEGLRDRAKMKKRRTLTQRATKKNAVAQKQHDAARKEEDAPRKHNKTKNPTAPKGEEPRDPESARNLQQKPADGDNALNASTMSNVSTTSTASAPLSRSVLSPSTISNIDLSSPQRAPNKKRVRYSLRPTPSKLVPNDPQKVKEHGDRQRSRMMAKIHEITKERKRGSPERELADSKEAESVSVYQRDEFGLPQAPNPETANANLAMAVIKRARKLEKAGKFHESLTQYKRAKVLVPGHQGIQKKIDKLILKMDPVTKQLSFGGEEEPQRIRKKLRKKTMVEIMSECDDSDHDGPEEGAAAMDVEEDEEEETTHSFSYSLNVERILDVLNGSAAVELKKLSTVGPKRADDIISHRPFGSLSDLRKIKGLHTANGWTNFIERNKIVFQTEF